MFNPRRTESEGNLSPSQAPDTTTYQSDLEQDAANRNVVGHNAQMQFISRIDKDVTTVYGEKVPKGAVIFLRQDFDTIENPFEFSSDTPIDPLPRAGLHFIGMAPSAQFFREDAPADGWCRTAVEVSFGRREHGVHQDAGDDASTKLHAAAARSSKLPLAELL